MTALSPVKVRLDALDIVRGIAVLGILLMNVISMGAPQAVHSNPTIIGWTWADQAIWWIHYVLASGTMRASFGSSVKDRVTRVWESHCFASSVTVRVWRAALNR